MTVSALQLAPGQEALATLAAAREAVAAGCGCGSASMSSAELATAIEQLAALESLMAAWRLSLAAEADTRGVAADSAATGTDAWLARLTGDPREIMRGGLWLARLLRGVGSDRIRTETVGRARPSPPEDRARSVKVGH